MDSASPWRQPLLTTAVIARDARLRDRLAALVRDAHPHLRPVGAYAGHARDLRLLQELRPGILLAAGDDPATLARLLSDLAYPAEGLILYINGTAEAHVLLPLRPVTVLKAPATDADVSQALRLAIEQLRPVEHAHLLACHHGMPFRGPRIALPVADGLAVLPVDDILFCCSTGGGASEVHAMHEPLLLVPRPLKLLEARLSGHGFLRIHRSYLVHRKHIMRHLPASGSVEMRDGRLIPVGRGREALLEHAWASISMAKPDEQH